MKHGLANFPGRGLGAAALAMACVAFAGCTTTGPHDPQTAAQQRAAMNEEVNETLDRLYDSAPGSRALVERAQGVLVFPNVMRAGFILGAEHGEGVLRVNGSNAGYYTTTAGSIGWQAGAQSRAIILLFMTESALEQFRNSDGWTAGADATVAVATIGANGTIDTNTAREDVVGFVLTNAGLMAGVSLEGAKIQKKDL